jgi:hypothetical protein
MNIRGRIFLDGNSDKYLGDVPKTVTLNVFIRACMFTYTKANYNLSLTLNFVPVSAKYPALDEMEIHHKEAWLLQWRDSQN